MKVFLGFLLTCAMLPTFAQRKGNAYSKYLEEQTSPRLLSQKLTLGLTSEKEKVNSIFYWITNNIAYNTGIFYTVPRKAPIIYPDLVGIEPDTLTPLNDRVAENVLRRRVAVCDGYARLFASLCYHAGIEAALVTGYVRTDRSPGPLKFRSNHTWNAVRIDGSWHLLDATWASGYVTFGTNQFVPYYNGRYMLASPTEFIKDHYPEDLRWTLLPTAPALPEFSAVPFRYQAFLKFKISAFLPATGTIEASAGDTLVFELLSGLKEKNLLVTADPISDSLLWVAENIPPTPTAGEKLTASFIVGPNQGEWLHVLYNGEPILRYRLRLRNVPLAFSAFN